MKQKPRTAWSCNSESGPFPVIATVSGVFSCFAQLILQKYFVLGSTFEIALALAQAVPFALVLRYLAGRLDGPNGATTRQGMQ
jgi:hypothetical protein